MLNQGYGWASNINLRFIFDSYFEPQRGAGYPAQRKEPQAASRSMLKTISSAVHHSLADILDSLPLEVVVPTLSYPGFRDLISLETIEDKKLKSTFEQRYKIIN